MSRIEEAFRRAEIENETPAGTTRFPAAPAGADAPLERYPAETRTALRIAVEPSAEPHPSAFVLDPSFEEAFRTLRSNFLLRWEAGARKVLMIAGAVPAAGQTTVAANLACALASSRRVLLVDANFRASRLHELFDVPNRTGLSDVLSGTVALAHAVQRVTTELWLLTSGAPPVDPTESLSSPILDPALDSMREAFDLIVIDSPPVLGVVDAMLIGARADGVLLVIKWGDNTEADVLAARERLEAAGSQLMGCVLSEAPAGVGD